MSGKQKKSYHHGDLRNSLIDAAIALLRAKGPNVFSMRELAKLAGVSHTAPYRHFEDKNAIFNAIAENGFQLLTERLEQVVSEYPDNPRQQLLEAGVAYVDLATENPEITQLMFGGFIQTDSCSERLQQAADTAFNGLLNIIKKGQEAGIYQQQDTLSLAVAAWSMMHGLAMLVTGGQLTKEISTRKQVMDTVRLVENILLNGMLE